MQKRLNNKAKQGETPLLFSEYLCISELAASFKRIVHSFKTGKRRTVMIVCRDSKDHLAFTVVPYSITLVIPEHIITNRVTFVLYYICKSTDGDVCEITVKTKKFVNKFHLEFHYVQYRFPLQHTIPMLNAHI